jgi:hypothetical protein
VGGVAAAAGARSSLLVFVVCCNVSWVLCVRFLRMQCDSSRHGRVGLCVWAAVGLLASFLFYCSIVLLRFIVCVL